MLSDCQECKKGLILYPAAIGDCLLTLPLAHCMKTLCNLERMDFIGTAGYLEFYPARTGVQIIRSIETVPIHRLFEDSKTFTLQDRADPLQKAFLGCEQIVSLIGTGHPHFEKNLLFTLHSSHCAELTMIPAKPPADFDRHITDYYVDCFKQDNQLDADVNMPETFVTPLPLDYQAGADLIEQANINPNQSIVLIHPGSGSLEKCWHLDNFIRVADDLKADAIQTLFLLGPAELERFPQADLQQLRQNQTVLENLSLTQILQLLTQTDAFLGNDSGIAHLSAMMGKKTLTLFGPSDCRLYHPLGPAVKTLHLNPDSFSQSHPQTQHQVLSALQEML